MASSEGRAKTLVLGIGNLLLRDDGTGVHAIRALGERYSFPQGGLELIDGATMGLDLLPHLEGRDRLLLVDAVDFQAPPGTIRVIDGPDIKTFVDLKFSVHQIGVPDMLFAAYFMGIAPAVMALVGIQPERIEAGVELSETLSGRLDELLGTIVRKLGSWGVEAKKRDAPCDSL